jgi:hypothetical protein
MGSRSVIEAKPVGPGIKPTEVIPTEPEGFENLEEVGDIEDDGEVSLEIE